jgi:hypothetical protein
MGISNDPQLQAAVAATLASALACCALYAASRAAAPALFPHLRRLSPADQAQWHSQVPSTVHAVAATVAAIYMLLASDDFSAASAGAPLVLRTSVASHAILGGSFGYFLYDTALMLTHPSLITAAMLAHHAAAVGSLVICFQVRARGGSGSGSGSGSGGRLLHWR